EDGLALYVQLPWGGAYTEPDQARPAIGVAFTWAAQLQDQTRRARGEGLIPPGWRLVVVVSRFAQPGWAWGPPPRRGAAAIDWHRRRDPKPDVDAALADLFAGRAKLG